MSFEKCVKRVGFQALGSDQLLLTPLKFNFRNLIFHFSFLSYFNKNFFIFYFSFKTFEIVKVFVIKNMKHFSKKNMFKFINVRIFFFLTFIKYNNI